MARPSSETDPRRLTRRTLLERSAAVGGLASLGVLPTFALPRAAERRTEHVILVLFAGGVRTRETLGQPEGVPTLARLAAEGVVYPRTRTANLGHFGATMSVFTGISEARGIRENSRPLDPTLFEYLRRDSGLAADDVWISTSGGVQQTNFSHSLHRDYGPEYGANVLDGDGILDEPTSGLDPIGTREFKDLLAAYGRPTEMEPSEQALFERMRGAVGGDGRGARDEDSASSAVVERYILDELTSGTVELRGANAADAKALRVGRNLVSLFQPKLLAVVLQQADVAHGSFDAYTEVIRQNDAALGELWETVRQSPRMRDTTAIIVLPEFGRDRDLNARRGLDHGDGSDDLNYVATVCWGPDFAQGREVKEEVRTIDVCSTVCDLFGARPRFGRGGRLPRLFA